MSSEIELERMVIRLIGDATSYFKMIEKAQADTQTATAKIMKCADQIEGIARQVRGVGIAMSAGITAPLMLIGHLAQSEFTEFEAALSRMEGLVGIASDEVAGFRQEILSLAGPVAKSPVELAKAMEFITGSGIKGANALETLQITAKAASAGLGETVEVANAVTSAMNAYGPSVLSATKATDILVATVREGKAEASSFAPVFGQVLPLAAEMGVSFGEVGGALAFLTRTTGNASIATTQLRSMMTQLMRPTEKSMKALNAMGITGKDISDSIRNNGLINTIQMLKVQLEKSGLSMKDMISDTEGLMGALQFVGPQAQIAADMIKSVENAAGDTQKAFDAAAKTAKFSFAQAMAETKIALIELGEIIAPVMSQMLSYTRMGMEAWKGLSTETKTSIVTFAAIAAVIGPVLIGLSTVVTAATTMVTAFAAVRTALTAYTAVVNLAAVASTAFGLALGVGILAVAATAAVQIYNLNKDVQDLNESLSLGTKLDKELQDRMTNETGSILSEAGAMKDPGQKQSFLSQELQRAQKEMDGYKEHVKSAQKQIDDGFSNPQRSRMVGNGMIKVLDDQLAAASTRLEGAKTRVQELEKAMGEVSKDQDTGKTQSGGGSKHYDTKELDKFTQSLQVQTATIGQASEQAKIYEAKLEGATDAQLRAARAAIEAHAEATKKNELNQDIKKLTEDLEMQATVFGMAADQVDLYKLSLRGASSEDLAAANAARESLKAMSDKQKLMDQGKELTKQFASPQQKLAERQKELDKLLAAGAIDVNVYTKAMDEAQKQMSKDYTADFNIKGIDAVAKGSAEAASRLAEYSMGLNKMDTNSMTAINSAVGSTKKAVGKGLKLNNTFQTANTTGDFTTKNNDWDVSATQKATDAQNEDFERMAAGIATLAEIATEKRNEQPVILNPANLAGN